MQGKKVAVFVVSLEWAVNSDFGISNLNDLHI